MARRANRGQSRAHWFLLLLAMLVLFAELALNGVIRHVGAEGTGGADDPSTAAAPAAVTGGGPVLDIGGTGPTTRAMPARTIALTFDDGPDPRWTPAILDTLARYHAHATFFVIGANVNEYPDLARRIVADGDEIGVHTFTHADLASIPSWRRHLELSLTRNAIAAATGRLATLMRPPYSSEPDAVTADEYAAMADVAPDGYLFVLADHDTNDWQRPGVNAIVAAATPVAGTGAVVMMHDGGGDRSQTVTALDHLLATLTKQGYQFTTVSQGLGITPDGSAPAALRWRGEAMRWTQLVGLWLARILTVFVLVAVVLAALRILLQLVAARIHVRRARRVPSRRRFLGPVTVVVPAYNEAANIAATVTSLVRNAYPDIRVIVVDDGSTDRTAEIVRRLGLPGVRVIRQPNAGKPAALNNGIRHAGTELLILVDGDTVFEPDAVGRLLQPLADPEVGAVSGNTKVANRRGLLGRWQHLEYVMGFNLDRRMFEVAGCMPTVPGAIGAFRMTALIDVGGIPADTLAEDTDLTMSIIRAGWRVVYEQSAIAWTEAPSSLRQLWRQRYRWCYGTMQAMWKHRGAWFDRGPSGRFGRRGLTYLLLFQMLLPLAAPAVDVFGLYGVLFLPLGQVAAVWLGLVGVQAVTAAYALRLDGERLGPLWTLPLQQIVYRQLMYLVVAQSTVTALAGIRLRWHRIVRTGAAQASLPAR